MLFYLATLNQLYEIVSRNVPPYWLTFIALLWASTWIIILFFACLDSRLFHSPFLQSIRIQPAKSIPLPYHLYISGCINTFRIQCTRQLPLVLAYGALYQYFYQDTDNNNNNDSNNNNKYNMYVAYFFKGFLAYFVTEVYFYTSHRIMHNYHFLYHHIHKHHHRWIVTFTPAAFDSTWTESTFAVAPSVLIGAFVSGMSYWQSACYTALGIWNAQLSHCGYQLWESIEHEYHHIHRKHNFGSMNVLDKLLGTYHNPGRRSVGTKVD